MKYDTIIFDLDGTLLDTLEDLMDSLNHALVMHGYEPRTLEQVRQSVGDGVKMLVRRSLPENTTDEEIEKCLSDFTSHYKTNMRNKTRPYNGIKEILYTLKIFKCNVAIVSNKFDSAVKELADYYFPGMIDAAIGESAEVRRKPAPDSIYAAIRRLGSDISKSIFVGDSETDVRTAKNAGIPCIGVTWGFRSRRVLEKEGADYIIDYPTELFSILK